MSNGKRLDELLVARGLAESRSAAANLIKLGLARVNKTVVNKPSKRYSGEISISLLKKATYVSRAAYKLESVAEKLGLDFRGKTILDVGSSTGGFTDFALKQGANKVVAVDVGTNQLHPKLRADKRVEVHEKTDIRYYKPKENYDIVVIDVSFISLREILPHIVKKIASKNTQVVAMLKPQFEAGEKLKNRGVIKNNSIRRDILKNFENWVKNLFIIEAKSDSEVTGAKGNQERFYLLKII